MFKVESWDRDQSSGRLHRGRGIRRRTLRRVGRRVGPTQGGRVDLHGWESRGATEPKSGRVGELRIHGSDEKEMGRDGDDGSMMKKGWEVGGFRLDFPRQKRPTRLPECNTSWGQSIEVEIETFSSRSHLACLLAGINGG